MSHATREPSSSHYFQHEIAGLIKRVRGRGAFWQPRARLAVGARLRGAGRQLKGFVSFFHLAADAQQQLE